MTGSGVASGLGKGSGFPEPDECRYLRSEQKDGVRGLHQQRNRFNVAWSVTMIKAFPNLPLFLKLSQH